MPILCHCSMGKRRLSFDVRKNTERKKYFKLNVRIPLELLKPFTVSLPLCNYTHAPITNGETLYARLHSCQLPTHWSFVDIDTVIAHTSTNPPSGSLYTVQCIKPPYAADVTFSVTIQSDLTWTLLLGTLPVPPSQIPTAPTRLLSVPEVHSLLTTMDSLRLCIGNPDEEYVKLIEEKGPLMDKTGTCTCSRL